MTSKLVTITSDAPVTRAARLMYAHKVRRLPVVDEGKLVGIVGDRMVAAALPSAASGLSPKEMSDTLSHLTVREVMHREVVTVTPETTAESALALAQENKVGCLVVVDESGELAGILSTNDFIYRILNPLLGLGKPGVRLQIEDCAEPCQVRQVMDVIDSHGLKIEVVHIDESPEKGRRDLIVQLLTREPKPVIDDLAGLGYKTQLRKRKSWPLPDEV